MHHLSRNNSLGATRLLTAALRKLEPYAPSFANINVTLLRDDIRDRLHTLATHPADPTHPTPHPSAVTHIIPAPNFFHSPKVLFPQALRPRYLRPL